MNTDATYVISDEQFREELIVNAFINQITGFPVGHRKMSFKPIVTLFADRERTLNSPSYTFTDEQKKQLLELA